MRKIILVSVLALGAGLITIIYYHLQTDVREEVERQLLGKYPTVEEADILRLREKALRARERFGAHSGAHFAIVSIPYDTIAEHLMSEEGEKLGLTSLTLSEGEFPFANFVARGRRRFIQASFEIEVDLLVRAKASFTSAKSETSHDFQSELIVSSIAVEAVRFLRSETGKSDVVSLSSSSIAAWMNEITQSFSMRRVASYEYETPNEPMLGEWMFVPGQQHVIMAARLSSTDTADEIEQEYPLGAIQEKSSIDAALRAIFGTDALGDSPQVAVRKAGIAAAFSELAGKNNNSCTTHLVDENVTGQRQSIRFVRAGQVNCGANYSCKRKKNLCRTKPAKVKKCKVRCQARFLGKCVWKDRDPACVVSRQAELHKNRLDAALTNARCNVDETSKVAMCNAGRELDGIFCRAGNTLNSAINQVGEVGSLKPSGTIDGKVKICPTRARLSPTLESAVVDLKLSGGASLKPQAKFFPSRAAIMAGCVLPTTFSSHKIHVNLPLQEVPAEIKDIEFQKTKDGGLEVRGTAEIEDVKFTIIPSVATAFLLSNDFIPRVTCTGLSSLITLQAIIDASKGKVVPTTELKHSFSKEFTFELGKVKLRLAGRKDEHLEFTPFIGEKSIIYKSSK